MSSILSWLKSLSPAKRAHAAATLVALIASLGALTVNVGGGSTTITITKRFPLATTVASPVPAAALTCDPSHFYMQCALPPPPPSSSADSLSTLVRPTLGVDFAWGAPTCQALKAAGRTFGASYQSYDPAKDWKRSTVQAYHSQGCSTVDVWETTSNRAAQGFNAGFQDAFVDRHRVRALGKPDSRPDIFAIDFDASGPQVSGYFQGANAGDRSVTHLRGNVDAYGGAGPLAWLCNNGLVGHQNWATYAWLYRNGGSFPSARCAPLQQYSNDHTLGGISVDYDRGLLPDYGQWPYNVPKPKPAREHCFGAHHSTSPACRKAQARVAQLNAAVKRRNGEIVTIRRLLLQHRCRDIAKHPVRGQVYVSGPNYHRNFCTRLFDIGRGDHATIAADLKLVAKISY